MQKSLKLAFTGGAAAAALLASTETQAQAAPPRDAAAVGLEEVVVTARRRAEGLQETPISITAVTAERIETTGALQLDSLSKLAPNAVVMLHTGSIAFTFTSLRGIGVAENIVSTDPPVGTYLDGVYSGRTVIGNSELVDLERVEVLRGPQGTNFGRNTIGGAISMVSRTPTVDMNFEQKLGYGSFNQWYARSRLNTGEIGTTGLRMLVTYLHRETDGYVDNPQSVNDPMSLNVDALWAKVHGEWGAFQADYSVDYTDSRGQPPAVQVEFPSVDFVNYFVTRSAALGGIAFPIRTERGRAKELPIIDIPNQHLKVLGHTLTLQYAVSDALTIKSITGHRQFELNSLQPYGPSGLRGVVGVGSTATVQNIPAIFLGSKNWAQHQFSEEIQILGDVGDFSYVAGLYYFDERARDVGENVQYFVLPGGTNAVRAAQPLAYWAGNISRAAFGQVSWKPSMLDRKLELTVGVRHTRDKKSIDQLAALRRSLSVKYKRTDYNVTAKYDWTPDIMTYVRYGTGYRGGGFNVRAVVGGAAPFVFEPEYAKVYEAGFKSEFLSRRVRLNGAVFRTNYSDLQVGQNTFTGSGIVGGLTNARAVLKGFELEGEAVPVENLSLTASVGYVDPKYKALVLPHPTTGLPTDFADISEFPLIPKWTANVGLSYRLPDVGPGGLLLNVNYFYQSGRRMAFNSVLNPRSFLAHGGAYGLLDARATLLDVPLANGTVEVSVWGKNLANKEYRVVTTDFGALGWGGTIYGAPRSVGVDVKFDF